MFPSPPQMSGLNESLKRGTQRALPVRQHLGQRLHGHVRALGKPVHVPGDGRLARRQVREVMFGARVLIGNAPFSVARIGHRVPVWMRGEGVGTKVAVSHRIA
ncbi:hypothetical protein GCM10022284_37870 [Streptomyces hundungensis]